MRKVISGNNIWFSALLRIKLRYEFGAMFFLLSDDCVGFAGLATALVGRNFLILPLLKPQLTVCNALLGFGERHYSFDVGFARVFQTCDKCLFSQMQKARLYGNVS